ncbi:MAG: hypothetical protein KA974_11075 [Saprospiraceae bacterium]|nr:hypothetical protein [Saprospiraceae bacterium]MBP7699110.1 hypothetical protein [Saprospiraceae bacterium]
MTNAYNTKSMNAQSLHRFSLESPAKSKSDKTDTVLLLLLGLFGLIGFVYVLGAQL